MSPEDRAPRVSVKTIGCRLNQAESARIMASFRAAGYEAVVPDAPADVCVVHTCAVTANAERKCMQFARSVKRHAPRSFLVLAGCAVETSSGKLAAGTGADLVAGQADKFRLPELIAASTNLSFRVPFPPSIVAAHPFFRTTRALVKVQDGCDFSCSYCIVPRARGNPVSRPIGEIVAEAQALAEDGYKEVVLTGANLGCYRDGRARITEVVGAVEAITGIKRIRLSSIEVSTAERQVVEYMSHSDKLCRYLHIPLQSGSDSVLCAMGRRYTFDEYRGFVEFAVERVPGLGLGTDIIVGFPGENERDFEQTANAVRRLPFSNLHVFPYSRRDGTRAAHMKAQVPEPAKKARAEVLAELGEQKHRDFAESLIGKRVSVLVEEFSDDGHATGWTGEYVRARMPGSGTCRNDIVEFVPDAFSAGMLRSFGARHAATKGSLSH